MYTPIAVWCAWRQWKRHYTLCMCTHLGVELAYGVTDSSLCGVPHGCYSFSFRLGVEDRVFAILQTNRQPHGVGSALGAGDGQSRAENNPFRRSHVLAPCCFGFLAPCRWWSPARESNAGGGDGIRTRKTLWGSPMMSIHPGRLPFRHAAELDLLRWQFDAWRLPLLVAGQTGVLFPQPVAFLNGALIDHQPTGQALGRGPLVVTDNAAGDLFAVKPKGDTRLRRLWPHAVVGQYLHGLLPGDVVRRPCRHGRADIPQ